MLHTNPATTLLDKLAADNPTNEQIINWLEGNWSEIKAITSFDDLCRIASEIIYKVISPQQAQMFAKEANNGGREFNIDELELARRILLRYFAPFISNFEMIQTLIATLGFCSFDDEHYKNNDYSVLFTYLTLEVIKEKKDVITRRDELAELRDIFVEGDTIFSQEANQFINEITPACRTSDENEIMLAIQYLPLDQVICHLMEHRDEMQTAVFENLYLNTLKEMIFRKMCAYPVYDIQEIMSPIIALTAKFDPPNTSLNGGIRLPFLKFIEECLNENKSRVARGYGFVLKKPIENYLRTHIEHEFYWAILKIERLDMGNKIADIIDKQMAVTRSLALSVHKNNFDDAEKILAPHSPILKTFTNFDLISEFLAELNELELQYYSVCNEFSLNADTQHSLPLLGAEMFHHAFNDGKKLSAVIGLLPVEARHAYLQQHGTCAPVSCVGVFSGSQSAASVTVDSKHQIAPTR